MAGEPISQGEWKRRARESQARSDRRRVEVLNRSEARLLPRSPWLLLGCLGAALFAVGLLALFAVALSSAP